MSIKFSELPLSQSIQNQDIIPIVRSHTNYKINASSLNDLLSNTLTPLTTTNALTGLLTPLTTTKALTGLLTPLTTTNALTGLLLPIATFQNASGSFVLLSNSYVDPSWISSLADTKITGNKFATNGGNLTVQAISSRFLNLEHSAPNDGINPVFFIGERGNGSGGTVLNSLTGFNLTYNEQVNKLIISTQFGNTQPASAVIIDSNGNTLTNTLTVSGQLFVIPQGGPDFGYFNLLSDSNINGTQLSIGGLSGAYIDLSTPYSDDFDLRIWTSRTPGSPYVVGSVIATAYQGGGLQFQTNGFANGGSGTQMIILSSGNVGIGTVTPGATLTVNGSISSNDGLTVQAISSRFINLEHLAPNDGINPVFFIGERGDGTGGTVLNSLSGFNLTYNEIQNKLIISTQFGVSALSAVAIDSSGNVGIGTITPNNKLTVVGDVSATGAIVGPTGSQSITVSTPFDYLNTLTGAICACFTVPTGYNFVPNSLGPTHVFKTVAGSGNAVTTQPQIRLVRNGSASSTNQLTNSYTMVLSADSTNLPQYFTQTPSYIASIGGKAVGVPGDVIGVHVVAGYVGTSYTALTGQIIFYGSLIPV